MQASVSLGRWFGIPIGLHYSWFFIAALITLSLVSQFSLAQTSWSPIVIWAAAVLAAVLFFVTLLLHELSHAVVARRNGLVVRSITLFALGGVAHIEEDPRSAGVEFRMAAAGPATSFAIGLACLAVAWSAGWRSTGDSGAAWTAIVGWLGYINVVLGAFNLIPGYPLDGGRVLRAILWARNKDAGRATRQAARVGQFVAFAFIAFGLLSAFTGAGFGGLWLAFIGWFLLEASRSSETQATFMDALRGVRVGDLMGRDCGIVEAAENLQTFVDRELLRTGRRCFVVVRDQRVAGLITPNEVRRIARAEWQARTVEDAMRPLGELRTVTPEMPASEALKIMVRDDIHQLPVVSNGHLDGLLTRAHILQAIQSHVELAR